MVGTQVQVGGGNGTHSPLSLGGEGLRLVVAGGGGDDLIAVLVDGDGGRCCQLRLFLGLLLNLGDLLALAEGAEISMPRMMSRISDCVSEATFTL